MTLYNKDGSIYKLSSPNPVMKEQQIWTKFIVHNMKWKPEYREDGSVVLPLESDLELTKTQTEVFLDELSNSKEIIKKADPEQTTKKEPVTEIKEIKEKNIQHSKKSDNITKTFVYCLPAIIKEKIDNLYGDVFKTIQYENPTSFEAVILSQTDMSMEMWSDVCFKEESILYPKNGDKRWWKISNVYPKLGGWIINSIPSQDQPSFE